MQLHQEVVYKSATAGHEEILEYERHVDPRRDHRQIAYDLKRRLSAAHGIDETCKNETEEHLPRHRDERIKKRIAERRKIVPVFHCIHIVLHTDKAYDFVFDDIELGKADPYVAQ